MSKSFNAPSATLQVTGNSIENIYPQSPSQEAMFRETLSAPDSGVNVIQLVWKLSGTMNFFAFEQAWQQIVARHPILRTLFVLTKQNKPVQVVRSHSIVYLQDQDWRELTDSEQRIRLNAFLLEDALRGFELSKSPPMRLYLLQVSDEEYWFVWSIHHLLLDRWSLSILVQELFACYEALLKGQRAHFEPSRSYGEYVMWLQKQDPAKAEAFWREQLRGFQAPTALHWALKREQTHTKENGLMAVHEVTLSTPNTKKVEALARTHTLTLSTILQGAWALLLSDYSGSSDIVFGTVVSGRSVPFSGIATVVGPFLSVLPMRVQVAPSDSAVSFLRKVQDTQIAISQYEYCPLIQVQSWSEIPNSTHMFATMVDLVNYTVRAFSPELGENLRNTGHRSVENVGMPMSVLAYPGAHMRLELSYNERLIDSQIVTHALEKLAKLLLVLAENPYARLSELLALVFGTEKQMATVA